MMFLESLVIKTVFLIQVNMTLLGEVATETPQPRLYCFFCFLFPVGTATDKERKMCNYRRKGEEVFL